MRISLKQKYHDTIYLILLIILAMSIPVSNFLMSASTIFLVANWLWEGNFKEKFKRIYSQEAALFIILFYVFHIISLAYSENIDWAIKDLNVKLPILVLPIIIAGSKPLEDKKFNLVLLFYSAAVLASSFVIYSIYLDGNYQDIRDISPYISHIRYSMNVVLSIFIVFWLCNKHKSAFSIFFCLLIMLWFLYIIIILQSVSAVLLIIICILIINSIRLTKNTKSIQNIVLFALSLILLSGTIIYLNNERNEFYDIDNIDFRELDIRTINDSYYLHDTNSISLENGHYVWIYICNNELEKEWNKISDIKYYDTTKSSYPLSVTLIRYMTSKGLRKDSLGFTQLTADDIKNIEYGYTNYKFTQQSGLQNRIYVLLWEMYEYQNTSYSKGYSLSQRIELWKTSLLIIKDNWLFGIGIGDIKEVFKDYLEAQDSSISESGLRSHNQYLATLITTGIFGLILLLLSLFYPLFKKDKISLFMPFFIIIVVSMISEDLLETQAGVTFFAFFICFFLFANKKKQQNRLDNVSTRYEEV